MDSNTIKINAEETLQSISHYLSIDRCYPSQEQYQKILTLRKSYYQQSAPHLLVSKEAQQEQFYDQMGILFLAFETQSGEPLASLRLTKRPFELEVMQAHEIDFTAYDNYWEVGRLVTSPKMDRITAAQVVKYLLYAAGLVAFKKEDCHGFVAICRPFREKLFHKFGLKTLGEIFSPQRSLRYLFLVGTKEEIILSTSYLQKQDTIRIAKWSLSSDKGIQE